MSKKMEMAVGDVVLGDVDNVAGLQNLVGGVGCDYLGAVLYGGCLYEMGIYKGTE